MISIYSKLLEAIPSIEKLCKIQRKKNIGKIISYIVLDPENEHGSESISISAYNNHIILSYDYYERRFDFEYKHLENTLNEIFNIVEQILTEQLMSVTTYSTDINISKVSDLYPPSKVKKIRRAKKFRARSWLGTYDDECI